VDPVPVPSTVTKPVKPGVSEVSEEDPKILERRPPEEEVEDELEATGEATRGEATAGEATAGEATTGEAAAVVAGVEEEDEPKRPRNKFESQLDLDEDVDEVDAGVVVAAGVDEPEPLEPELPPSKKPKREEKKPLDVVAGVETGAAAGAVA